MKAMMQSAQVASELSNERDENSDDDNSGDDADALMIFCDVCHV